MNTKVYVDNPAAATTENDLMKLFSVPGNVVDVNIVVDRANHKPRGCGFVTMAASEGARTALRSLQAKGEEHTISSWAGRGRTKRATNRMVGV